MLPPRDPDDLVFERELFGFLGSAMHYSRLRWLNFLDRKFVPTIFYDIGANNPLIAEGQQVLLKPLMPNTKFYLFEATQKHEPALIESGEDFAIAVLGERDGEELPFYESRCWPLGSGDSCYREQTPFYDDENCVSRVVSTTKLDTLVHAKGWPYPDFIKLDTQGSEVDILKGATTCLEYTRGLQLECSLRPYNLNAPLIADIFAFVTQLGFKLYDFTQFHFANTKELLHVDLTFVR